MTKPIVRNYNENDFIQRIRSLSDPEINIWIKLQKSNSFNPMFMNMFTEQEQEIIKKLIHLKMLHVNRFGVLLSSMRTRSSHEKSSKLRISSGSKSFNIK